MYLYPIYGDLAKLRCAEREERLQRNWEITQALAASPRVYRGSPALIQRIAVSVVWGLARLAGMEAGRYTVKETAILLDASGQSRIIEPKAVWFVLLPYTDKHTA